MCTNNSITNRLTRSPEGYLGGICEGLGRRVGISPYILRVLWLAAVLLFGTGFLLYLVLWWVIPLEGRVPVEPTVWVKGGNGSHHPPLARTSVDRKLFGVCGGIARRLGVDPTMVRLVFAALVLTTGGVAAIAYVIAALLMPAPEAGSGRRPHPVEV